MPPKGQKFLSTLSLRRATQHHQNNANRFHNFYPRSPCGERRRHRGDNGCPIRFLSTLSLRRATLWVLRKVPLLGIFLSTLSLRRATTEFCPTLEGRRISIHALLAESDTGGQSCNSTLVHFYPRSPCGERPRRALRQQPAGEISIHALLAESDTKPMPAVTRVANFYPRSPCGERHGQVTNNQTERQISIHALLAESDRVCQGNKFRDSRFLSTLSLRRATPNISTSLQI